MKSPAIDGAIKMSIKKRGLSPIASKGLLGVDALDGKGGGSAEIGLATPRSDFINDSDECGWRYAA